MDITYTTNDGEVVEVAGVRDIGIDGADTYTVMIGHDYLDDLVDAQYETGRDEGHDEGYGQAVEELGAYRDFWAATEPQVLEAVSDPCPFCVKAVQFHEPHCPTNILVG